MDILFFLTSILFFVWLIADTLFWTKLWEARRFGLTSLLSYIIGTSYGRSVLLSPLPFLKLLLIFAFSVVVFYPQTMHLYHLAILGVYVLEGFIILKRILVRGLPIFRLGTRSIVTAIVTIFFLSFIFSIPLTDRFLWILFLDRLLFMVIGFLMIAFSFPAEFYRDVYVEKTAQSIEKKNGSSQKNKKALSQLTAIVIIGDDLRKTTKHFLTQVLKKYPLFQTNENYSTPVGVANLLRMHAHKNGILLLDVPFGMNEEVMQLAKLVQPNIVVVTDAKKAAFSLFKDMDRKHIFIEKLGKKGVAFFNAHDRYALQMYEKTKKEKKLYGMSTSVKKETVGVVIGKIFLTKQSVSFRFIGERSMQLTVLLYSSMHLISLLPALAIADFWGMKKREITQAVEKISAPSCDMEKHILINGATFFDVTARNTLSSLPALFTYVKLYKGRKTFIFAPSEEDYIDKELLISLRKAIDNVFDDVFVLDKKYRTKLADSNGKRKTKLEVIKAKKLQAFLLKNAKKDDYILCFGNEASKLAQSVL